MFCSPDREHNQVSCFTKKQLVFIAKKFNEKYPKNQILGIDKLDKKKLWNEIRSKLSKSCNTEWCWIDSNFIKDLVKKDPEFKLATFRPPMPSSWVRNKYTWLSTTDILLVMKQYELKYPDFMFLGPVPVDCPTGIMCELTYLNLPNLHKKGITKVGIVFNLDKHDQPGSHWTGLWIDTLNKNIHYYDSYGDKPHSMIKSFMNKLSNQMKEKGIIMKQDYNRRRHQFGGSECGIYSMNFIIENLNGKTLKEISSKPIPDRLMNELRHYLYRPPSVKTKNEMIGGYVKPKKSNQKINNE